MATSRRKGAYRYMFLAIIPQSFSRGFEAMGDKAVAQVGIGHGAGAPYYIAALACTIVAIGLFALALKRIVWRLLGKDGGDAGKPTSGPAPATLATRPAAETIVDDSFDADAAFRNYMANRPQPNAADVSPTPATRQSGFGRKGI